MISNEKSISKKRGVSQSLPQKKKLKPITRTSNVQQNKKSIKISPLNLIPNELKKFFIYKLYSLNEYMNNSDFREIFLKGKINYEKELNLFKSQARSVQTLNKKNKENKNDSDNKVKKFVCTGGYKDICNALKKRGWIQIKETKVDEANYIWTLKTIEVNFQKLKSFQLANHYQKAYALTRKSGLCKNIRNLFFKHINPDNFYPRCYDLSNKSDFNDFIYDFKLTRAISILIKFTLDQNISEKIINTCLNIVNSNLKLITCDYGDNKNDNVNQENMKKNQEDINNKNVYKLISDNEWDIISGEEKSKKEDMNNLKFPSISPINKFKPHINSEITFPQFQNSLKSNKKLLKKITTLKNQTRNSPTHFYKNPIQENNKRNRSLEKKKKPDTSFNIKNNDKNRNKTLEKVGMNNSLKMKNEEKKEIAKLASKEKYLPIIENLLNTLKTSLPQFSLNGYHNIWIMKPSNLSRGRSIQCFNSLTKINENISTLNCNFVVQKYIENPLIIYKRKFDIRQWVLVTNLQPLTIWMWEEPYVRFSAEDYDINNFSNIYSHLTNNSIAKYSEKYKSENLIKEDMWELENFKNYLKENFKRENIWDEIYEKFKNIIICSFDSGRHEIVYRENCEEIYGYDFMIDSDLNVFLIEINSSPAMDYSTSITQKLVQEMSENLIQIVIDKRDTCSNYDKIGKFIKVYDGKEEISQKFVPNKNLLY